MNIGEYRKAIFSALSAGIAAALALPGDPTTWRDWLTVIGAMLGAFGVVYGVPNDSGEDEGLTA